MKFPKSSERYVTARSYLTSEVVRSGQYMDALIRERHAIEVAKRILPFITLDVGVTIRVATERWMQQDVPGRYLCETVYRFDPYTEDIDRLEQKILDAHRNAEILYDYLKDVMRGLER